MTQIDIKRIEIVGGIASGKTTLATVIESYGISAIYEEFRSNPFWEKFYLNPKKYAFETEISFLLQHYHQLIISENIKLVVVDYSFFLDCAYAHVTLDDKTRKLFLDVHNEVIQRLGPADVLVHLECSADEELQRVRNRARDVESSIGIEYLDKINRAVIDQVEKISSSTAYLKINSEENNFRDDLYIQETIVKKIKNILKINK